MNILRCPISYQFKNFYWKQDFQNIRQKYLSYLSCQSNQAVCICCGSPLHRKHKRLSSTSGPHSLPERMDISFEALYTLSSSSLFRSGARFAPVYSTIGLGQLWTLKMRHDHLHISRRGFHTSYSHWKDESKLGKAVKDLEQKQEKEKEKKLNNTMYEVEKLIAKQDKKDSVKKPLWERTKAELKHYYNGLRLFVLDLRVALRLTWNLAKGGALSRRERKQLVRTVSDIFRLVPFMVFLIIPFMELLLPFYIKFFPFMLPSTFKEEEKENRKILQRLKGKLEMAKFLQDTLMETSVVGKMKDQTRAKEFVEFLQMVRETGKIPKQEDIMNYCSLFEDNITLDTLTYEQLKALCKLLEISAIGPSAVLRLQLEMRVRTLKADDFSIAREGGVEKMAVWELISACRERGMRALGLSEDRLRLQLEQWLHLHLDRHIPITLLLITRAMYLPELLRPEEQLTEFILRMPQTMMDQTELSVAERAAERIDPQKKIDVIKQEQAAIERENEERQRATKPEEAEVEMKEKVKEVVDEVEVAVEEELKPVQEMDAVDKAPTLTGLMDEEVVDKARIIEEMVSEELEPDVSKLEADLEKEGFTRRELQDLETAIAVADSTTALDEEELEDLQEEIVGYETDVRRMEALAVVRNSDFKESTSAKRLVGQVNKMISDMNTILNENYKKKTSLQEEIEVREVRMRHAKGEDTIRELSESIASKKEKVISINELMLSIRRMQRLSDDTRWQTILEVLDEDCDGQIELHHVMKVINMLGRDNVKLSREQMERILDTIDKEAIQERLEMQRKLEQVEAVADSSSKGDSEDVIQSDTESDRDNLENENEKRKEGKQQ